MTVTATVTNNGTGMECTEDIAGLNQGTVDNCSFSGTVNGGSKNDDVGGIAGTNSGNGNYIKNCYNTVEITATANTSNVGGIVGNCLSSSVV